MTDQHMIDNPKLWPKWPILPLKRNNGEDVGFLIAWDYVRFVVINESIFTVSGKHVTKEMVESFKRIRYKNAEEIVKDGWVVD